MTPDPNYSDDRAITFNGDWPDVVWQVKHKILKTIEEIEGEK